MYVLYVEDDAALTEATGPFVEHMEPLLACLESTRSAETAGWFPEIDQYLQVCRWPFRQVEYAFALDSLARHLRPGDRYLDAGSGVTPLAYAVAGMGVSAEACDGDARIIEGIRRMDFNRIFGVPVTHAAQDLTRLSYPDATFDAISCISVLEHIPAPYDQVAVRELLRVLKPGGLLIVTVDYAPAGLSGETRELLKYRLARTMQLVKAGDVLEIARAGARKLRARRSAAGLAHKPRSANQCFTADHLKLDILPLLEGERMSSRLAFRPGLRSVTPEEARHFWDMRPGLFALQGRRLVIPAALAVRRDMTGHAA